MDLTIGFKFYSEKLRLDVDLTEEELQAMFTGTSWTSPTPISLTDKKGRITVLNPAAIGWVQFGAEEDRKVGFGL